MRGFPFCVRTFPDFGPFSSLLMTGEGDGTKMTNTTFSDRSGRFAISIDVYDDDLAAAMRHDDAEAVLQSAVLLALATLIQAGRWPGEALLSMSGFMSDMRRRLLH